MWPFRAKSVQLKIQTVLIEPVKLRLAQWQADPNLTGAATTLLKDGTFKLMLQVANNEHPALIAFRPDASLESRALHQAMIEGYNRCLRNFEAMGQHTALPKELEATFEQEERATE